MDRKELARRCARIDAAGGSVREFLKEQGFISPWGTWHRLQREELGRKEYEITDGKGSEEMGKITLEQRKKAVDLALSGESPLEFLKKCGAKNPTASWVYIKKVLKEAKPELYAQLMAMKEQPEAETIQPDMFPTNDGSHKIPYSYAEISGLGKEDADPRQDGPWPNEPEEPANKAIDEDPRVQELTENAYHEGWLDAMQDAERKEKIYTVTALETDQGEFHRCGNTIFFHGVEGYDVKMDTDGWKKLAADLPQVLAVLGV